MRKNHINKSIKILMISLLCSLAFISATAQERNKEIKLNNPFVEDMNDYSKYNNINIKNKTLNTKNKIIEEEINRRNNITEEKILKIKDTIFEEMKEYLEEQEEIKEANIEATIGMLINRFYKYQKKRNKHLQGLLEKGEYDENEINPSIEYLEELSEKEVNTTLTKLRELIENRKNELKIQKDQKNKIIDTEEILNNLEERANNILSICSTYSQKNTDKTAREITKKPREEFEKYYIKSKLNVENKKIYEENLNQINKKYIELTKKINESIIDAEIKRRNDETEKNILKIKDTIFEEMKKYLKEQEEIEDYNIETITGAFIDSFYNYQEKRNNYLQNLLEKGEYDENEINPSIKYLEKLSEEEVNTTLTKLRELIENRKNELKIQKDQKIKDEMDEEIIENTKILSDPTKDLTTRKDAFNKVLKHRTYIENDIGKWLRGYKKYNIILQIRKFINHICDLLENTIIDMENKQNTETRSQNLEELKNTIKENKKLMTTNLITIYESHIKDLEKILKEIAPLEEIIEDDQEDIGEKEKALKEMKEKVKKISSAQSKEQYDNKIRELERKIKNEKLMKPMNQTQSYKNRAVIEKMQKTIEINEDIKKIETYINNKEYENDDLENLGNKREKIENLIKNINSIEGLEDKDAKLKKLEEMETKIKEQEGPKIKKIEEIKEYLTVARNYKDKIKTREEALDQVLKNNSFIKENYEYLNKNHQDLIAGIRGTMLALKIAPLQRKIDNDDETPTPDIALSKEKLEEKKKKLEELKKIIYDEYAYLYSKKEKKQQSCLEDYIKSLGIVLNEIQPLGEIIEDNQKKLKERKDALTRLRSVLTSIPSKKHQEKYSKKVNAIENIINGQMKNMDEEKPMSQTQSNKNRVVIEKVQETSKINNEIKKDVKLKKLEEIKNKIIKTKEMENQEKDPKINLEKKDKLRKQKNRKETIESLIKELEEAMKTVKGKHTSLKESLKELSTKLNYIIEMDKAVNSNREIMGLNNTKELENKVNKIKNNEENGEKGIKTLVNKIIDETMNKIENITKNENIKKYNKEELEKLEDEIKDIKDIQKKYIESQIQNKDLNEINNKIKEIENGYETLKEKFLLKGNNLKQAIEKLTQITKNDITTSNLTRPQRKTLINNLDYISKFIESKKTNITQDEKDKLISELKDLRKKELNKMITLMKDEDKYKASFLSGSEELMLFLKKYLERHNENIEYLTKEENDQIKEQILETEKDINEIRKTIREYDDKFDIYEIKKSYLEALEEYQKKSNSKHTTKIKNIIEQENLYNEYDVKTLKESVEILKTLDKEVEKIEKIKNQELLKKPIQDQIKYQIENLEELIKDYKRNSVRGEQFTLYELWTKSKKIENLIKNNKNNIEKKEYEDFCETIEKFIKEINEIE